MTKLQQTLYRLRTAKAVKDAVADVFASKEEVTSVCAHSYTDGAGTKATGYALPEMGPFKCSNCVHIDKGGDCCDHPKVVADPDVPTKEEEGKKLAVVKPDSCCNYFHPKDKGEPSEA